MLREEAVPLSRLIDVVNDRFGTDFNQADQLFFDQIIEAAISYQRPFQLTCVQVREVMEAMALGSFAKKFHALQQASTMSS